MASNIDPNFTAAANFPAAPALITAGNTSSQGGGTIGTDIFKVMTAGANGAQVDRVEFWPSATTPTTTTATVARLFLSSVTSGATTSANTVCIGEVALPATAADNASNAVNCYPILVGYRIPAGYTLLATNHVAPAANTAWRPVPVAGDF